MPIFQEGIISQIILKRFEKEKLHFYKTLFERLGICFV